MLPFSKKYSPDALDNSLPPVMASNHTAGPPTLYGLEPRRQPSRWPEFKGDQDAEGPYEC